MRFPRLLLLVFITLLPLFAQDPGDGAPASISSLFVNAFYRNRFNALVSLPAAGNVRALGTGGYVQEFYEASATTGQGGTVSGSKFALIKGNAIVPAGEISVYQFYPAIYSYFNSIGVNTAGFPLQDTSGCASYTDPTNSSGTTGRACSYSIFSKNYALFTYSSTLLTNDSSASYAVRDPFFTRWATIGGITGLGPAVSAESVFTSKTALSTTTQQYFAGALYSIATGALTGKVFPVSGKIYKLYFESGMHLGSLGIPITEELSVGGGVFRQTFEGGSIQYTATTDAVIRPAVGTVTLSIASADITRINVGESITVRARVTATTGEQLTDRQVTWVTSNGRILSVTPSADTYSAVLKGASGGTAQITAVSDGKSSGTLTVFVSAPCCQIGEGAPTTAIQQSFQDAVTRLRLNIVLPAANPVRRMGIGYAQDLLAADGTRYLLCRSDRSPGVYAVSGDILKAYLVNGGPAGTLAYPISDPTPTGRQMFEGGALAGSPVLPVYDPLLTRWGSLGYETATIGPPLTVARTSLSFTGAGAVSQSFAGAFLLRILTGPHASTRVMQVTGKLLQRYAEIGGTDGDLGFPVSDAYADGDAIRQNFEGGQLFYRGDGDVEQQDQERKPLISVTPSKVVAGGRVRVIVGGFPNGSALRVSFNTPSGIAPFQIQTVQGSYTWESPVSSTSRTGVVTVTAQEVGGSNEASASYTVTALAEAITSLTKKRGDTQQGLPGAVLTNPLMVSFVDDLASPLIGIPVKFTASPGSGVVQADAVTNERGEASASVRLQQNEGIVLVTAEVAGKVVTFTARAAAASLNNFPRHMQTGALTLGNTTATFAQKGALLAATSSTIRYLQGRNELPGSMGLVDPAVLNEFLKNFCVLDTGGGSICDGYLTPSGPAEPVLNLWRLKDFLGNNVDIEVFEPSDTQIVDLLNQGVPTILALRLSLNDSPVGSHFVVATGVGVDGSILIHDPNSALNRSRLDDYLAGFTASGRSWKASVLSTIRLAPRSPSPSGFLVSSGTSPIAVDGPSGGCGVPLALPGSAVVEASQVLPGSGTAYLYYCGGLDGQQIVRFSGKSAFTGTITDLGNPGRQITISGNGGESFALDRVNSQWRLGSIDAAIDNTGIVNAASLTPELAPGSLAVVTGKGLGSTDYVPKVTVGGQDAVVQLAGEFRLNVEVPQQLEAGEYFLRVESVHGFSEVPVTLLPSAPAIFQDPKTGAAMIVNVTGNQANSAGNPVARGGNIQIYATGLGALRQQGNIRTTVNPVSIVVQGAEITATTASPAPNLPGIYIVTGTISQGVAPGLDVPLKIRQNGLESNAVAVSVR
ncbi:MAG: hypothetical protein HY820_08990 [Acidobacteria bacterium]|nr:hypothetical protein [Acidobacteriota bacterium]